MSGTLTVTINQMGQKKPVLSDFSVSIPPQWSDGSEPVTLRTLIERVVRNEVAEFRERQEARQAIRYLSAGEIDEAVSRGKVEMGGSMLDQEVDAEEAVGAAIQAFEDGIFLVVIDEQEQRELDREVYLQEETHVTFIRLTLLAGG